MRMNYSLCGLVISLLLSVTAAEQCLGTPAQILGTIFQEGSPSKVILHDTNSKKLINAAKEMDSSALMGRIPVDPCGLVNVDGTNTTPSYRDPKTLRQRKKLVLNLPCDEPDPPMEIFENFHIHHVAVHRARYCAMRFHDSSGSNVANARVLVGTAATTASRRQLLDSVGSEIVAGAAGCGFLVLGGGLAAWQVKHLSKQDDQRREGSPTTAVSEDIGDVDLYHFDSRASAEDTEGIRDHFSVV